MGQRHQLFIIARIPHRGSEKARYRCLVAMHHQWLYGRTALAACKAFLTLVRTKENADIIRAELASFASEYNEDEELPPYPAPFLNWLIYLALTTRNDDKYFSSASIEDPNMGSHDGDNNDGITVFDVTDPATPAYCFVSIDGIEAGGSDNVKWNVPVSGEAYVRAYYPSPGDQSDENLDDDKKENIRAQEIDVQRSIDSFKDEKLIELWMLAEAWPGSSEGYEHELAQLTSSVPKDAQEALEVSDPVASPHPPPVPSLSELSLRKAISYAEESKDMTGLDLATSLPGSSGAQILTILAERENYSSDMFHILLDALSNDSTHAAGVLDLSPYTLSSEQVIDATRRFPETKVLNLNGNSNITRKTVQEFLPSLPNLSRLVVYDCPGISLSDIDSIRTTAPLVHAIYHRDLMIRSLTEVFRGRDWRTNKPPRPSQGYCPPSFTFAFKIPSGFASYEDILLGCSLSSLSPRAIVVAMSDFHDHLDWTTSYDFGYSRGAQVFFSSLPRAPHVPFKERGVGNVPGPATLARKGWIYLLTTPPDSRAYFAGQMNLQWGFVRYRFSTSGAGESDDDEKPILEEVDVVDLETWLKEVDTKKEVEEEWVERLAGKLSPSDKMSMITLEQAREILSGIPLFRVGEES